MTIRRFTVEISNYPAALEFCLWIFSVYLKIYIGTQSKCTKLWKQSLAIKQFLKTLFLAIKMCTDFPADVIWMNAMCAVSLANHLRAVADRFHFLRTH